MLTFLQAVPERYSKYKLPQIDEFFALGRGLQKPDEKIDVPSLVCRKWWVTEAPTEEVDMRCIRKW